MLRRPPLVVGKHGPEATERFGRDAGAKLGEVPLQIAPDEILSPNHTVTLIGSKQAFGKPPADPEAIGRDVAGFQDLKWSQFQIGDSPGQGFSGLFEQVGGCGTQKQILSGAVSPVDQAAEDGKKAGGPVHLIENDEPVHVVREIKFRSGKLGSVLF